MILGGTVVGMGAYNWLLRVTTPAVAGSYAFVNPVVAVMLAWRFGDGLITVRTLASTACVVAAVVLCRLGAEKGSVTHPEPGPIGSALRAT